LHIEIHDPLYSYVVELRRLQGPGYVGQKPPGNWPLEGLKKWEDNSETDVRKRGCGWNCVQWWALVLAVLDH
jgi:hypothetical protein